MASVLIVDDDSTNRDLIMRSLRKDNYQCLMAKDGHEALALADSQPPDLVILDIMMPGMTGYQVCEALRRKPETKNILVLFLSARNSASTERVAIASGGDRFMSKPFSPSELRNLVKTMLADGKPISSQ